MDWFLYDRDLRHERPKCQPHKMIKTLIQFAGYCRQIVRVCLTILWGWRLKGSGGRGLHPHQHSSLPLGKT